MRKIALNAIECNECKQVLVSSHRHDFRVCGCESASGVDGGRDYLRRQGTNWTELSIMLDSESNKLSRV